MKITIPIFSLVIPTFEGTPFLKRTLDYFRHVSFKGKIVLSDNSRANTENLSPPVAMIAQNCG
jgi:hypothetical protein